MSIRAESRWRERMRKAVATVLIASLIAPMLLALSPRVALAGAKQKDYALPVQLLEESIAGYKTLPAQMGRPDLMKLRKAIDAIKAGKSGEIQATSKAALEEMMKFRFENPGIAHADFLEKNGAKIAEYYRKLLDDEHRDQAYRALLGLVGPILGRAHMAEKFMDGSVNPRAHVRTLQSPMAQELLAGLVKKLDGGKRPESYLVFEVYKKKDVLIDQVIMHPVLCLIDLAKQLQKPGIAPEFSRMLLKDFWLLSRVVEKYVIALMQAKHDGDVIAYRKGYQQWISNGVPVIEPAFGPKFDTARKVFYRSLDIFWYWLREYERGDAKKKAQILATLKSPWRGHHYQRDSYLPEYGQQMSIIGQIEGQEDVDRVWLEEFWVPAIDISNKYFAVVDTVLLLVGVGAALKGARFAITTGLRASVMRSLAIAAERSGLTWTAERLGGQAAVHSIQLLPRTYFALMSGYSLSQKDMQAIADSPMDAMGELMMIAVGILSVLERVPAYKAFLTRVSTASSFEDAAIFNETVKKGCSAEQLADLKSLTSKARTNKAFGAALKMAGTLKTWRLGLNDLFILGYALHSVGQYQHAAEIAKKLGIDPEKYRAELRFSLVIIALQILLSRTYVSAELARGYRPPAPEMPKPPKVDEPIRTGPKGGKPTPEEPPISGGSKPKPETPPKGGVKPPTEEPSGNPAPGKPAPSPEEFSTKTSMESVANEYKRSSKGKNPTAEGEAALRDLMRSPEIEEIRQAARKAGDSPEELTRQISELLQQCEAQYLF